MPFAAEKIHIFLSPIPKKSAILAARYKVINLKNHTHLRNEYFFKKIANIVPFSYFKDQSPKRKFEIKYVRQKSLGPLNIGKLVFDPVKV